MQPKVIWKKQIADLESPVAMMLKLKQGEKCSFMLESVMGGEQRGRYSILALDPDLVWRCKQDKAEVSFDGTTFEPCIESSLPSLKKLIRESQMELPPELPPMAAGLIGFMGYDMVKQMETLPHANPDPISIPDACFMRPRITIIHDSAASVIYIVAPIWRLEKNQTIEQATIAAEARITATIAKLNQPFIAIDQRERGSQSDAETSSANPEWIASATPCNDTIKFTSNFTLESYKSAVEKAKEYIRAGEIFQVVPAQRFQAPFELPSFALYRALRHLNPSPFLFYLDFGGFSMVGSSPEILVRLRDNTVTIRPIAGTRPRGKTLAEDTALAAELINDPKEIAEHLMLLDLGRNDVGRVAKGGTVRVTEQMIIERYSHVMHIVSNVEGTLREDCDAVDALIAGFPAGTVSGAPKIRAMEIIDELEPETRSFYGGCVGYFSANGTMDTCITLRTALVKDGILYVQAGGGVVADSDPQAEYEETCNKAKAVMKAAEIAHEFV
jgi:anthranilate synthase component 1